MEKLMASQFKIPTVVATPIIIDIETIPNLSMLPYLEEPQAPKNYKDPEKIEAYVIQKRQEMVDSMALDIDHAKIKAVGLAIGLDGNAMSYIVNGEAEEKEILKFVWELIAETQGPVIGWNIRGFDLPILKRRAWHLDIPVNLPGKRSLDISRYSKEVIDLMQLFYNEGYGPGPRARSLKVVFDMYFGDNPLPDLDGSKVLGMEEHTLRAYVENDVNMTQTIAFYTKGWYW